MAIILDNKFAVLVTEQLFAAGCRRLLNLTSAGRIAAASARGILAAIDAQISN